MVGDMLERGRLPGAGRLTSDCVSPKAFGTPRRVRKSSISSLRTKPYSSTATSDPKKRLTVSVQATALPWASMTEKWLVPASAGRGGIVP